MHPVLFQIPLPDVSVPLGPALLALCLVSVVVAELGRRARAWDLLALGGAGALVGLSGARSYRDLAVRLEPVPIYSFGVMLSSALVLGWFLSLRLARRDGLPRDAVAGTYFTAALSGLVGARILYVLTNLRDFHSLGDVLAFRSGGLVFYGAVVGGFAGSLVYLGRRGLAWLEWADIAVPSLALGSVIGRLGCYLAGCDYGVPLGPRAPSFLVKLGTFPRWADEVAGAGAGSPAWVDHVLYRGLPPDSIASLPVHPTQLYESLAACGLLALLLALLARRSFRGQVFLAFVAGYGALRFLLETVRDDPERGAYGPVLAFPVLVAVGLVVLATAFVIGPSRSFVEGRSRLAARALALAVPVAAYAALRTGHAGGAAFSTSQWIAMLSSIAVGVAWRLLEPASRPLAG